MARVLDVREVDRRIARIASGQRGLITRAQLLDAGLSSRTISHRASASRLHRVLRGVYSVGHTVLPERGAEWAALLACGPQAVLSHLTAAVLWGLLTKRGNWVEVTVVGRSLRSRKGLLVHRAGALGPLDRTVRHGLAVTTPMRTLLDLAEVVDARTLELAVATAETKRLVSRERLLAYLEGATGRKGVAPLRALLRQQGGPAFTRSGGERKTLALLRSARLPPPQVNAEAAGYEVDFLWPAERLAVEMDSFEFHSSRSAFELDHRKTNDLESAGYRVRRFTWRQISEQPHVVVAVIAAALAQRSSR